MMPSAMSIAGNTTVVGGASDIGSHDFDDFGSPNGIKKFPMAETTGVSASASKRPKVPFVSADNLDIAEGRPFFVKIGKDGVLAALKKLDAQLTSVRNSSASSDSFPNKLM